MQRLPAVNPFDASKYPNAEGTFDVGAANEGSKVLFYNESPANIDLDFLNGSTDVLHAWEANFWTLDADTKQIQWQIDADSLNVSAPPVSAVFMTLYQPQERLGGTYPMALIRQASLGNPGGLPSSVSTLQNTGNPTGTNVVSVGSTAAAGNTWIASNDGLWTLAVTIAAALVQVLKTNESDPVLQLGAATHLVEILGNLSVDGVTTFGNYLTSKAGTDFFFNVAATNRFTFSNAFTDQIHLDSTSLKVLTGASFTGNIVANGGMNNNTIRDNVNGNTAMDLSAGDGTVTFPQTPTVNNLNGKAAQNLVIAVPAAEQFQVNIGGVNYLAMSTGNFHVDNLGVVCSNIQPGGTRLNAITFGHVAAATATVTHGLGGTPSSVIITPDIAQPGSATVGVGNVGATTFDAHIGAGTAFYWVAMR